MSILQAFRQCVVVLMLLLAFRGVARADDRECFLGAYRGRIVDQSTGEPVAGVVVHAVYGVSSVASSPGAAARLASSVAVRETLTDDQGKFVIPAERLTRDCPAGGLSGRLQIFKPGFGAIGDLDNSRYCLNEKNEKVYHCDIEFDQFVVYEIAERTTSPERRATLKRVVLDKNIPERQQALLAGALRKEKEYLEQAGQGADTAQAVGLEHVALGREADELLVSVRENRTARAVELLEKGADVNGPDELGFTPLMYAAQSGNIQLMEVLLKKGAAINWASNRGRTPLIEAVLNDQRAAVDLLIASGADLKPFPYMHEERIPADALPIIETYGKNKEILLPVGRSVQDMGQRNDGNAAPRPHKRESLTRDPLSAAYKAGREEMAAYLLDRYFAGEEHREQRDSALRTALQQKDTSLSAIGYLLAGQADINSRNENNFTPLMHAAHTGNPEIVDLLLARGAEANAVSYTGQSPLLIAITQRDKEVVAVLLRHGAKPVPLPYVRKEARSPVSKEPLTAKGEGGIGRGAPLPGPGPVDDEHALTPLSDARTEQVTAHPVELAIDNNLEEICLLLLKSSAVMSRDDLGKIFQKSLKMAQYRVADILIGQGADVRMEAEPGVPLLNFVVQDGFGWMAKKETVDYLCRRGAEVNRADDKNGSSPLHWVAARGDAELAEILLRHGAKINARSKTGKTPLLLAGSRHDAKPEMIRMLLNSGADPNLVDDQKNHLLLSRTIVSNPELLDLLLKNKADPNVEDRWNRTPLFHAVTVKGTTAPVQMLLAAGVDPNHRGKDPITFHHDETVPIKVALKAENIEAARLLLAHGADIKADCMKGMVVAAMENAHREGELLAREEAKAAAARKEVASGIISEEVAGQIAKRTANTEQKVAEKERLVSFLAESGAELNEAEGSEMRSRVSPLMYASQIGRLDYLQVLIDHGAEIDFQNGVGETALIKAVEAEQLAAAAFLLEHGADVRVVNQDGFSPYWLAQKKDNQAMADLLVKHGAETLSYNAHVAKITSLKATGILPADLSPADISPRELEYFLSLLAARFGVDDPEHYAPDPRLASPEKTWELHKQAIVDGDFPLLKKTFSSPDHPLLEVFDQLGQEKRRQMVRDMRTIERITQDDNRAQYRIHKEVKGEEITFYIYFSKTLGEWKIDEY